MQVLWVLLDVLVTQVHLVLKETKVAPAHQASPASRDLLVTQADQACLDQLGSLEPLDQKEPKERLVQMVVLVLLANQVPLAQQESEVCLGSLAHLVLLVVKENEVIAEKLALRVSEVMRVPLAHLVLLVQLALSVFLVKLVFLVLMANLDLPVLLAALETRVPRDPLVHKVAPVQLACLVLLGHQDPLVLLENVESEEKLVPRVWRALVVPEESQELLGLRVKREKLATVALREARAIVVSLVCKVFLELKVLGAIKVSQAWQVLLVLQVSPVLRVPLAVMEELDFRVSWDPQALVVLLVRAATPVSQAHLVPLVLLVLLESPWAMVWRCWQLFWARVKPRALILYREMTLSYLHDSLAKKLQTMRGVTSSPRLMNSSRRRIRSS